MTPEVKAAVEELARAVLRAVDERLARGPCAGPARCQCTHAFGCTDEVDTCARCQARARLKWGRA